MFGVMTAEASARAVSGGPPLWALGVRDLLVLGLAISLVLVDVRARTAGLDGAPSLALALAAGVAVTLSAFHAHEWGHYLGARLAGARPRPGRTLRTLFLFELDESECSREQWLAMSAGGYVASVIALGVIASIVDLSAWSGRITMVLVGLGVLATFLLEIPITVRVYRRAR
jgi:hypothetical protein